MFILIKLFYLSEIPFSQAYYHYRKGQILRFYDLINCVIEIVDGPVCQDYQYIVIGRLSFGRLRELNSHIDNLAEFAWTVRLDFLQILSVKLDDLIDSADDERLEVIAIESKALTH